MTIKSPCIDNCKLNPKTNTCEGCYRTSEEISNWTHYSSKQKKKVLKLIKFRKPKILCFAIILLIAINSFASDIWMGKWLALDQWQSEFLIKINKDGTAFSEYGAGEEGSWSVVDGNLEIKWKSGKTDYLFNGVMGYQRLSKDKNNSYTSGLKKLLD